MQTTAAGSRKKIVLYSTLFGSRIIKYYLRYWHLIEAKIKAKVGSENATGTGMAVWCGACVAGWPAAKEPRLFLQGLSGNSTVCIKVQSRKVP